MSEADPTGRSPHELGTKLDAGKVPVFRGALSYFPRAIAAVAAVSEVGACKYAWRGWESVPDGFDRYSDALARHLLAEGYEHFDGDTGMLHAAQVAWNALARLELLLRHRGTTVVPEPKGLRNAREKYPYPCPDLDQECCGGGDCVGCPTVNMPREPVGVSWESPIPETGA